MRVSLVPFLAAATAFAATPTVKLDQAVVTGVEDGLVHKFLGIPYALPPVGELRFRNPKALGPYLKDFNATRYGPYCIQQDASRLSNLPGNVSTILFDIAFPLVPPEEQSEDCLTLNIVKPANATSEDRLPVVAWFHGGGWHAGGSKPFDNFSKRFVERSIAMGKPVIWMSFNYRLTAYGFLASEDTKAEGVGNAGLIDQRETLHFIKQYGTLFGADPKRVTMWGQSSGAMSIAFQLMALSGNTQDIYHAAFLQSGAAIPVGDYRGGQKYYDFLVSETGCGSALYPLACLRQVPVDRLNAAISATPNIFSYSSLVLPFIPRPDGGYTRDVPQRMVQQQLVGDVPVVIGSTEDEGTFFSFVAPNLTSEVDFREYISQIWFSNATAAELAPLWQHYPSDPAAGSPYNTGDNNAWTPQFKRLASFQGDFIFQAPRRFFLESLSGRQKVWSYITNFSKGIPWLGSYHGGDLRSSSAINERVIAFAHNHDPNLGPANGPAWPQWTVESPQLFYFGGNSTPTIVRDDFRSEEIKYLNQLAATRPI